MKPLPPPEWSDSLAEPLASVDGSPFAVHELMANNPDLMLAWWPFRQHMVNHGANTGRDSELVVLRVAHLASCDYIWLSHARLALQKGLTTDDLERLKRKSSEESWTDRDATLISAVDACMERQVLSPRLLARLEDHFTDPQILEIVALVGMYSTLATMANSWRLPPE